MITAEYARKMSKDAVNDENKRILTEIERRIKTAAGKGDRYAVYAEKIPEQVKKVLTECGYTLRLEEIQRDSYYKISW